MKNKFLLLSLGLTLSHYAFSQCNNSGIGTLNPNAKLEVRGCGTDSTTAAFKVTNSTDTTTTPILFLRNDKRVGIGTKYPTEKLSVIGNATFSGSITAGSIKGAGNAPATFDSLKVTGLSGSGNRSMYVDDNGNLRIGNPITLTSTTWDVAGNTLTGTLPSSPVEWFGSENNADLIFKTDATANPTTAEKMRIKSNGNVGIGTTNPQHQLQLYSNDPPPSGGDALRLLPIDTTLSFDSLGNYSLPQVQPDQNFRTLQVTNNTTGDQVGDGILLGVSGTAGFLEQQENAAFSLKSNAGLSLFTMHGQATFAAYNGAMFLQSKGVMRFRVNNQFALAIGVNGNVGVGGATAPTAKLEIGGTAGVDGLKFPDGTLQTTAALSTQWASSGNDIYYNTSGGKVFIATDPSQTTGTTYELNVCGTILSKEWIVETNWCDFKFEPNYQRMTWQEKLAFIKEHKHLPEISSGNEIEKSGLKTAATMRGFVWNIEDNTMDIIDLQKENEALKTKNTDLEKRIASLENIVNTLGKK